MHSWLNVRSCDDLHREVNVLKCRALDSATLEFREGRSGCGSEMEKAWKVAEWMIVIGLLLGINPRPVCAQRQRNGFFPRSLPSMELVAADQSDSTWIWPLPAEWSKGTTTLAVDPQLKLVVLQGNGSNARGGIVAEAFERHLGHMNAHQSTRLRRIRRRDSEGGPALQRLIVNVFSNDETVRFDIKALEMNSFLLQSANPQPLRM